MVGTLAANEIAVGLALRNGLHAGPPRRNFGRHPGKRLMGYQYYGYGMRVDDDHTLTIEDITQGYDVSDAAIFADALNTSHVTYLPRSNARHARHLPRRTGNSDAGLMDEIFAEEAPVRPFAGRRSQFDRD
jgi:hypothetical protein